jgi:hypothetical protein
MYDGGNNREWRTGQEACLKMTLPALDSADPSASCGDTKSARCVAHIFFLPLSISHERSGRRNYGSYQAVAVVYPWHPVRPVEVFCDTGMPKEYLALQRQSHLESSNDVISHAVITHRITNGLSLCRLGARSR